ncbi:siderophore ABC transporter substrate-binding protein [Limimaricola pyoseonensis]|uniref:Iron complex transport system substrate-binding protein n=1 Tax=Limimaricola pyoseonensis TaxID=521013 RepID=A0A1G7G278_9RHOB|nr:siderophore ABC transporter substrate-binding protein [Limimaricola pyoseonensis]SDE82217.1 iron complex transport system substrate-binding protein [Limimaricola pyoseonensis]
MLRLSVLFAAGLAALPALAASAETVTIETARGPAEAPRAPQTVAVYDIAAIDTLTALGVTPAGVPDNLYLDRLAPLAETAEAVGTLFEPDLEALNALAPDLVIVGGRSSEQLDSVGRVAPSIDMTIWGDDMIEQALDRLKAYGDLFGKAAEADALAAQFQAKLDRLQAAAADEGDAMILMTNGPKVTAYGAGSRFGWLHAASGLPEAVEAIDEATHGEAVSFEFIAEADPDWLIVIDRAAAIGETGAGAAETLDNALVADTTAWREDQVVYLNSAEAYIAGGGIGALESAVDALLAAFDAPGA